MRLFTEIRAQLNSQLRGKANDFFKLSLPELLQEPLYQQLREQYQHKILEFYCHMIYPLMSQYDYVLSYCDWNSDLSLYRTENHPNRNRIHTEVTDPISAPAKLADTIWDFLQNLPDEVIDQLSEQPHLRRDNWWQTYLVLRKMYTAGYQIDFIDGLVFQVSPPASPYHIRWKPAPRIFWYRIATPKSLQDYATHVEDHLKDAYHHETIRNFYWAVSSTLREIRPNCLIKIYKSRVNFYPTTAPVFNYPKATDEASNSAPICTPNIAPGKLPPEFYRAHVYLPNSADDLLASFRYCRTHLGFFFNQYLPKFIPAGQQANQIRLLYHCLLPFCDQLDWQITEDPDRLWVQFDQVAIFPFYYDIDSFQTFVTHLLIDLTKRYYRSQLPDAPMLS